MLHRASSHLMTPTSNVGSPMPFDIKGKGRSVAEGDLSGTTPRDLAKTPEQLMAMLLKILEEKDELKDKKFEIATRQQETDEYDMEWVEEKLAYAEIRVQQIKAAIAVKQSVPSSSNNALADNGRSPFPSSASEPHQSLIQSEPSKGRSSLQKDHPTPTVAGPSRLKVTSLDQWNSERQGVMSSDDSVDSALARRPLNMQRVERKNSLPSVGQSLRNRPGRPPTPPNDIPPDFDEFDIAMAEEEVPKFMEEGQPPPPPSTPPMAITPPRPVVTMAAPRDPFEEFQHIPLSQLFGSSPVNPKQNNPIPPGPLDSSPPRPIDPPPSLSRSAGPSTTVSKKSSRVEKLTHQVTPQPQRLMNIEKEYPWSQEVRDRLRKTFGLPGFRKHQKEAIDETMAGKDVFVLMPTGGGKSLTYQLPAVCNKGKTRGVTFVISPLLSLINDQTRQLIDKNIPAIPYTGDLPAMEKREVHAELSVPIPSTKVVYVTPEMMSMGGQIKSILRSLLQRKQLARFVIDEAHCVSQWGHDFRSEYLKLDGLRRDYPGVPIMALTATAQQKVQEDIIRCLGIEGCLRLHQSFNRPNLTYEVRHKGTGYMKEMVAFIKTNYEDVSGIIYCNSRDSCENLAKKLREEHNLSAEHFHGKMSKKDKMDRQEGWQQGSIKIIVATIAFGMGIDKPDVRYVIHQHVPRSLEGYYQETGRAGRDGNPSQCVLYYAFGDGKKLISQAENDKDLSRAQRDRQKESLQEVLRYCQNKTDCRRSQVLAFFGETFDPVDCNESCDNCTHRETKVYRTEDVTEDAIKVLKMLKAFDKTDRITVLNAAECFRGFVGKSGKGLNNNPYFGVGQAWERNEGERLIQALMLEGALDEYCLKGAGGWSNSYLKMGPQANKFLNGTSKLCMDFVESSPRKAKSKPDKRQPSKTASNKKMAPKGQTVLTSNKSASTSSNPMARKRSLQQIQAEEAEFDNSRWGDTDDEEYEASDSIKGSGDDTEVDEPVRAKKRKSLESSKRGEKPVTRAKARTSTENKHEESPVESCFKALEKMKNQTMARKSCPDIPDDLLQMIALMMPSNDKQLKEMEGITSDIMKTYSTKIFGICIKYRDTAHPVIPAPPPAPRNLAAVAEHIRGFAYNPSAPPKSTLFTPAKPSFSTIPLKKSGSSTSSASTTPLTAMRRPVLGLRGGTNVRKDKF